MKTDPTKIQQIDIIVGKEDYVNVRRYNSASGLNVCVDLNGITILRIGSVAVYSENFSKEPEIEEEITSN